MKHYNLAKNRSKRHTVFRIPQAALLSYLSCRDPSQIQTFSMATRHLQEELLASSDPISVPTRYGPVTGGRALNGARVFLGEYHGLSLDQISYGDLNLFI